MNDQAIRDAAEIARLARNIKQLRRVLQDFYDWCGKDYPGWRIVEHALKEIR